MKVLIINLRQLIVGLVIFLVLLIAGIVLLVADPFTSSSSYQSEPESVPASAVYPSDAFSGNKPMLTLDVNVEGNTADVKMMTQNFQFTNSEEPAHGEGHAHLFLNGQLIGKVYESEFLLKKLPKGEHELKVELTYSNHLPYKVGAVKMIEVK